MSVEHGLLRFSEWFPTMFVREKNPHRWRVTNYTTITHSLFLTRFNGRWAEWMSQFPPGCQAAPTHWEDFHLQPPERHIWHRKSGHIHALDAFAQTLVCLFGSQCSQSRPACKRPHAPCALHHPQSAFCSQRKWCNRPSSFQRSGSEEHVAAGAILITMAAVMSPWSSRLLKKRFSSIYTDSDCLCIYIYCVETQGWKNKEVNTWTGLEFESLMRLLVGLPCSSVQPVQRGSTEVALQLFILVPELQVRSHSLCASLFPKPVVWRW